MDLIHISETVTSSVANSTITAASVSSELYGGAVLVSIAANCWMSMPVDLLLLALQLLIGQ